MEPRRKPLSLLDTYTLQKQHMWVAIPMSGDVCFYPLRTDKLVLVKIHINDLFAHIFIKEPNFTCHARTEEFSPSITLSKVNVQTFFFLGSAIEIEGQWIPCFLYYGLRIHIPSHQDAWLIGFEGRVSSYCEAFV